MRTVLTLVLAVGCAASGGKPMTPVKCTTFAECEAHDQQRVELVGIYKVYTPRPNQAPDDPKARQVQIVVGESGGPFLEPGGHPRHLRDRDEIAKFRDKRVRVVGTFVRWMPEYRPPEQAQLRGPCIRDVESIELAE